MFCCNSGEFSIHKQALINKTADISRLDVVGHGRCLRQQRASLVGALPLPALRTVSEAPCGVAYAPPDVTDITRLRAFRFGSMTELASVKDSVREARLSDN